MGTTSQLGTIAELKNALSVGARPNLFKVAIDWPTALATNANFAANIKKAKSSIGKTGTAELKQNILCKSAALPGMNIGIIEVPTRGGRRVKIPGDRTFTDWTVTFLSDEAHSLRFAFKVWQEYMKTSDYEQNYIRSNDNTAYDYASDLFVYQLNSAGGVTRSYKLYECFPTEVGSIDFSFDSTDALSEFTVTFQYHYMNALQGETEFEDDADMDAAEGE
ncbi:hypothetical protein EB118_14385 [bacterium]|nr:hypothetical protein [bacterium]